MDEQLASPPEGELRQHSDIVGQLRAQIRPALLSFMLLTLLTGLAFPLLLGPLAFPLFSREAGGSLIIRNHEVIGSELIGQSFSRPGYFHPRPSAAGSGYDATASGGTNLGPANPKLLEGAKAETEGAQTIKPFASVRELAQAYRRTNGLPDDSAVPIDAVTRSGSGLDPHISPANAALQIPRVAHERNLSEETVRRLVAEHTHGRQLGFLGEPRVAVLPLNLALDKIVSSSSSR